MGDSTLEKFCVDLNNRCFKAYSSSSPSELSGRGQKCFFNIFCCSFFWGGVEGIVHDENTKLDTRIG